MIGCCFCPPIRDKGIKYPGHPGPHKPDHYRSDHYRSDYPAGHLRHHPGQTAAQEIHHPQVMYLFSMAWESGFNYLRFVVVSFVAEIAEIIPPQKIF